LLHAAPAAAATAASAITLRRLAASLSRPALVLVLTTLASLLTARRTLIPVLAAATLALRPSLTLSHLRPRRPGVTL